MEELHGLSLNLSDANINRLSKELAAADKEKFTAVEVSIQLNGDQRIATTFENLILILLGPEAYQAYRKPVEPTTIPVEPESTPV